MSREAAQAFIARMKTDEDFRTRVLAVDDAEARMELIGREGYECTVEEIESWSGALADEEMEKVAGGVIVCRPGMDAQDML